MVGVEAVVVQLLNGIVAGSVLALTAIGLTIIFGMLGIVNFAHGAFYALGVYIAVSTIGLLEFSGAFFVALLVVPIGVGLFGAAVEGSIIRPIYDREGLLAPLLLTFGLMLVMHALIKIAWGAGGQSFNSPAVLAGTVSFGIATFPAYRLFIVAVTALIAGGIWLFLHYTNLGMIIRAATENRLMVRTLGIDINRIYTVVFALGTALAGLAGLLHAPMVSVYPEMGESILIESFVVVVIGGLGNFKGSIVAGLLVGIVSSLTFLVSPALTDIVIFLFMAVFLLIRPHGLYGQELGGIE